ncbi:MAG: TraR/DksA family transcriptional regulator [Methylococcales bacterium]|nr:TraR/DksA family transcriptional regulator [Methylococcaceae bacterium]
MKEYDQVRDQLIDMLEELDVRLSKITNEVKHPEEPVSQDFEEQASQVENDQVLDFLGNAARVEIEQIRHAIARIDNGEYGDCEVCGEAINPERLKAVPFTKMCIKCASAIK